MESLRQRERQQRATGAALPFLARNAALLHLAAELPPIVIADLLGIHPHTANRWSDAAGGRWMNYAAHRNSASSNIKSLPVAW